jgi:hypothetical protein
MKFIVASFAFLFLGCISTQGGVSTVSALTTEANPASVDNQSISFNEAIHFQETYDDAIAEFTKTAIICQGAIALFGKHLDSVKSLQDVVKQEIAPETMAAPNDALAGTCPQKERALQCHVNGLSNLTMENNETTRDTPFFSSPGTYDFAAIVDFLDGLDLIQQHHFFVLLSKNDKLRAEMALAIVQPLHRWPSCETQTIIHEMWGGAMICGITSLLLLCWGASGNRKTKKNPWLLNSRLGTFFMFVCVWAFLVHLVQYDVVGVP